MMMIIIIICIPDLFLNLYEISQIY